MRARGTCIALVVAAALAAGCGSDEPDGEKLPADAVQALDSRLDEIQRRFDDGVNDGNVGACNQIQTDSFAAIAATIEGLPENVDTDIRNALNESFRNLQTLTQDGCADAENQQTETETTPEQTETETTPEQTETETTPEQTDTTPTTPTTPDTGGNQGNGQGNGQGQGNGNGGGAAAPEDDG